MGSPVGVCVGGAGQCGCRAGSLELRATTLLARLRPAAGELAHRMLAGVGDLYTARAANRQPASADCGGAGVRDALADDLPKALAANRRPVLLAVGGDTCSSAFAEESFCTRAAAWQPALTGCGWLRAAPGYRHGSHTVLHLQHIPPRGSPSLALIGQLTHLQL